MVQAGSAVDHERSKRRVTRDDTLFERIDQLLLLLLFCCIMHSIHCIQQTDRRYRDNNKRNGNGQMECSTNSTDRLSSLRRRRFSFSMCVGSRCVCVCVCVYVFELIWGKGWKHVALLLLLLSAVVFLSLSRSQSRKRTDPSIKKNTYQSLIFSLSLPPPHPPPSPLN